MVGGKVSRVGVVTREMLLPVTSSSGESGGEMDSEVDAGVEPSDGRATRCSTCAIR